MTSFVRDRTTFVLYAALGVFGMLQVVPGLVTPALRDELGYGYTLASLHVTAFAALGLLAGTLGPRIDRHLPRQRVLLAGVVGMSLGAAGLAAGRSPVTTLLAAALAGLLGTLIVLTVQAGLADHHGQHRSVAFTESNVLASVGATASPLVVGVAGAVLGSWRWGLVGLAVTGLVVAAAGMRTRVPDSPAPVVAADDAPHRLPPAAWLGVLLLFCGVVLEWGVSYWGATYLREVAGLARPAAVTAMTAFFAAMLAGRVAAGWLVRRYDPARLVAAGLALVGAGLAPQVLTTSPPVVLAGLGAIGLGVSVLFPLSLALAVGAAPHRAALVSGRCIVAGSLAVLLGPLAVGQLADAVGLRPAMLVLPLTALAAAALLVRLQRVRTAAPLVAPHGAR